MAKTSKEKNKSLEKKINTRYTTFLDNINFGRMDFLDDASERMARLKSSGLSDNAIVETLYKEMLSKDGGTLAKLENSEANDLWDFMKGASQDTVFSDLDDDKMYKWVMNPGAKHCEGCSERNGQIKTLDEWYDIGIPGSGDTDCYYNCMCDLVLVEGYSKSNKSNTRIKGRDMKDLKAHKEAMENWKKAMDIAKDNPVENTTNESAEGNKPESTDEASIKASNKKFDNVTFDIDKLKNIRKDSWGKVDTALDKLVSNIGKDELVKRITADLLTGKNANALAVYKNGTITINTNFFGINASKKNIEISNIATNSLTVTIYHEQMHYSYSKHFKDDKTIKEFFDKNKEYILKHFPFLNDYKENEIVEEFFVEAMAHLIDGILIKEDNKDPNNKSNNDLYDFTKRKLNLLKPKENEKAN